MTPEIVTIGVYGWDEASFWAALQAAGVDTFVDIRRRRGVRGAAYAFANAGRLQAGLAALGIRYLHRLDLAPSLETRAAQETADRAAHVVRRQRTALDPAFSERYQRECLASFDSRAFLALLDPGARVIALFCVEGEPAACHRSLLAARLASDLSLVVEHLRP
jgi:hypothetical protein